MPPAFSPTEAVRAARWMVVDDNEELLLLMKLLLEQIHGDAVDCFNSPTAALKAFASAPDAYEVVITDFEMPGIDGIEPCRRLHAMAQSVKIFLATGSGFFTETAAAHAGFLGLLNKPFRPEKLLAVLANAGVNTAPAIAV
jgi:CheY-like chemotaxis protein